MKKRIFSSMFLVLCLSLLFSFGNSAGFTEPLKASAADYSASLPLYGEILGDGVYGYTTGYVCHGGSKEIQHKVQNGWHVTLKNHHYSYGIDWYECYDTDDGEWNIYFDVANEKLYLKNYDGGPIVVSQSSNQYSQLNIVLIGDNTITVNDSTTHDAGITFGSGSCCHSR